MKTSNELENSLRKLVDQIEHHFRKQRLVELKTLDLLKQEQAVRTAYKALTGKESQVRKPSTDVMLEIKLTRGPNAKLADVIEAILQEAGPLEVNDLISQLRKRDVRLSLASPRNVVANTVNRNRDKLTRLNDGRIGLREK
ncbi:MAG: hypothetical protein FJ217_07970 [Ignavibacteria bacterium]|nr:hypothetical protein [Ignavibacteria bacterium]